MAQKKKKKKRKKQLRFRKKVQAVFIRLLVIGCVLLFGYGGIDYYQNQNIEQTLRLLSEISEVAAGIPDKTEKLICEAEKAIRQLTGEQGAGYASFSMDEIPEYTGEPYVVINDNVPDFSDDEYNSGAFEYYSELDSLGRCQMAEAMITTEIMPTEERGKIGMVKPSGWHTVKYDNIDGLYLYNRCHLIAFELSGENANVQNLITGTRYMNVTGMLPWENQVAQYVRKENGKVIYRVTPVFEGDDLVARGVHMEAESIGSDEIRFNIFVFNVQPGIGIDYANGNSWKE